eukprot:11184755-Alexandrium_andersonii.AAC.1
MGSTARCRAPCSTWRWAAAEAAAPRASRMLLSRRPARIVCAMASVPSGSRASQWKGSHTTSRRN